MRAAIALLTALPLAVGAATPHQLRSDPAAPTIRAVVPVSVAVAYRHLYTEMRKCYDQSTYAIFPVYFADVEEAQIDARQEWGRAFVTVDLRKDGTGTAIEVRYPNQHQRGAVEHNLRNSIIPWAKGESGPCWFDATNQNDRSRQ